MVIEIYVAYFIATTLLVLMPGPIVTLVIANSLANGHKTGLATAFGATLGTGILLSIGSFGMAWLLDFLSNTVTWVRWLGAAYLIFLGIKQWTGKKIKIENLEDETNVPTVAFINGMIVAITNPKTVLFYAAFFPQFIDSQMPTSPQLFIMTLTFVCIALVIDGGYALLASRLRQLFLGEKSGRLLNRLTGTLLILTGIGVIGIHLP